MSAVVAKDPRRRPELHGSGSRRQPDPLAGFRTQLRFIVRRDRVRGSIWVVAFVAFVAATVGSVTALYTTQADLDSYAEVAQANVAIKALTGPGYGLENPTDGAVVMNEASLYTYVVIALMSVFLLVRHTRDEEATDRAELVGAAPVGRFATLAAAVVWVSGLVLVVSLASATTMVAAGLDTAGSFAYGAAAAMSGLVFVGVAAVAAQVGTTGRSARSLGGAAVGVAFLLRAVGDMGNGWMTWLSPIGVAQAIRPFADERWWVIAPLAALTVLLLVVAVRLLARRDLGAGLLRPRPGPARGSVRLASPFALAQRLQRTSLAGWAVGIGVMGFFFGLVADQAEALADNEAVAEIFAQMGDGTITEAFLATTVLSLALITSGFSVSSVLRLRGEELADRAETVLATPVPRRRWLWSHVGVAAAGSVGLMLLGAVMTGLGYGASVGSASEFVPLLAAGATASVGLLVVVAFAAALVGLSCRRSVAAWAAVVVVCVVGLLAETLDLPQWVRNVSPFEHLPGMPAAGFEIAPVASLIAVGAVFMVASMVSIDRRSIG